MTRNDYVIS